MTLALRARLAVTSAIVFGALLVVMGTLSDTLLARLIDAEDLRRYRDLMLWFVPPALAVAALAGWVLAAVALSPLVRAAAAVRAIDVNTLDTRLPVRGTGDELDRVVVAFNHTLDRLAAAVADMRQFSAALAHELRTPLAVLRGEIEVALGQSERDDELRRTFINQLEAIDQLKRLIDQILTLARAESGQIPLTEERVDLATVAHSVVNELQVVADDRAVTLTCESDGAMVVLGDAAWLQRLLINLLDNALKFTPAGGAVTVHASQERATARISVRDTGIGMTPDAARHAFERFYRADPARPTTSDGAGLGLSLAHWIVERHRGAITLETALGAGATFTVTLPLRLGSKG